MKGICSVSAPCMALVDTILKPEKLKLAFTSHSLNFKFGFTKPVTVNDSDLDSVTLKAYKVKDCGQHLGSDDCI